MAIILFIVYIVIGCLIMDYISPDSDDILDVAFIIIWPIIVIYLLFMLIKYKSHV